MGSIFSNCVLSSGGYYVTMYVHVLSLTWMYTWQKGRQVFKAASYFPRKKVTLFKSFQKCLADEINHLQCLVSVLHFNVANILCASSTSLLSKVLQCSARWYDISEGRSTSLYLSQKRLYIEENTLEQTQKLWTNYTYMYMYTGTILRPAIYYTVQNWSVKEAVKYTSVPSSQKSTLIILFVPVAAWWSLMGLHQL